MSHVQEAAAKIAALEGKPTDDAESYELEGIFDYNSDTEEEEDFDHVDGGLYQFATAVYDTFIRFSIDAEDESAISWTKKLSLGKWNE